MKQKTDKEHLLDEVLSTEPDSEFSAHVLAETLRGVRRQRRLRQVRRYSAALAAVIGVALLSSQFLPRPTPPPLAELPKPSGYKLVLTQPLASSQVTETPAVSAGVSWVQTTPGGFDEIGDDELISLAAPNIVALVRRGPHEAELVFVSSPTEDSSAQHN